MNPNTDAEMRAAHLDCWSGPVDPEPIGGGFTNTNFVVHDRGERYFVRVGNDMPEHGILRSNETAVALAAAAAGVSPEVVHSEPGALVIRFIDGRTLTPDDIRSPEMIKRIVPLVRSAHTDIPTFLRGPVLMFWVFHVIRGYISALGEDGMTDARGLPGLAARADILERHVGPIEIVLGHNDLLAANFIDDGDRLWLIDWDYAGFGSPLFDLGGLASNSGFTQAHESTLLDMYYGQTPDHGLLRRFEVMKCASLLRETLWSMTSEIHSTIDVDFAAYTAENLARFETAYDAFSGTSGTDP
jgi:thiamine kinase-like enzyme